MSNITLSSLDQRKALIAKIAKRHRADRDFARSLEKKNSDVSNEYDNVVSDEFQRVKRSSVKVTW
jgi:hypothetical protein